MQKKTNEGRNEDIYIFSTGLGWYLCSAGTVLGEHGLIQSHQAALSSSSTGARLQDRDGLEHKTFRDELSIIPKICSYTQKKKESKDPTTTIPMLGLG